MDSGQTGAGRKQNSEKPDQLRGGAANENCARRRQRQRAAARASGRAAPLALRASSANFQGPPPIVKPIGLVALAGSRSRSP